MPPHPSGSCGWLGGCSSSLAKQTEHGKLDWMVLSDPLTKTRQMVASTAPPTAGVSAGPFLLGVGWGGDWSMNEGAHRCCGGLAWSSLSRALACSTQDPEFHPRHFVETVVVAGACDHRRQAGGSGVWDDPYHTASLRLAWAT